MISTERSRLVPAMLLATLLLVAGIPAAGQAHTKTWTGTILVPWAASWKLTPDYLVFQARNCEEDGMGIAAMIFNVTTFHNHRVVVRMSGPGEIQIHLSTAPCRSVEIITEAPVTPSLPVTTRRPATFMLPPTATTLALTSTSDTEQPYSVTIGDA